MVYISFKGSGSWVQGFRVWDVVGLRMTDAKVTLPEFVRNTRVTHYFSLKVKVFISDALNSGLGPLGVSSLALYT